ncbi:ATP-binding protein [Falsiroseomonas ponticola]|uniref:ATP-binding protein n=1 Tax=Falsiroseomonas ponticola TaxID=2786951 RepID=UPI0019335672|nr:ATP-binding protein [Roseomonas ponticola]
MGLRSGLRGKGRAIGAGAAPTVLVILALLVAVPAWLVAEAVVDRAERLSAQDAYLRASAAAAAVGHVASHVVDDAGFATVLARRWIALRRSGDDSARQEAERMMRSIISEAAAGRTTLANIVIAGPAGETLWHSDPDTRPFSVADRPYFTEAAAGAAGLRISAPFAGRATAQPLFAAVSRLEDEGGRFAGIVIASISPRDVSQRLAQMTPRPNDVVAILRREGELLARSHDVASLLGLLIPLPADAMAGLSQRGAFTFRQESQVNGRDQFMAVQAVDDTNLVAFAAVDAEAEMEAMPLLRGAVRFAVLALSAGVLLALLFGRVTRRNHALADTAAALRQGREQVERLHAGLPVGLFLLDVAADGAAGLLYRAGGAQDPPPAALRSALLEALATGTASFEWTAPSAFAPRPILVTSLHRLSLRPDGGGEVVGYSRDVTVEREATAQVEAARRELDRTLEGAPIVVFRVTIAPNGRGTKTYVSRSIERMTGWPYDQVNAPGGLRAIFDPPQAGYTGDRSLFAGADEWSKDLRLRCADGRLLQVKVTLTVIARLPDGSADAVGYIADVTAERAADARAIAAARLASLGEMSAGLAHELKQPLQAIALAANNARTAMRRDRVDVAEQRLDRIAGYTQRAAALIEHLRRFARGVDEHAPPQPVPLGDAVEGAMALAGGVLREAGIEIRCALGDPAPIVLGHLVALEQVLANLLANAGDVLAARPPEAPRWIAITATPAEDGFTALRVADSGGGLPDLVLARMFEPFVTTKGPDRGTGLGLSICHGLVVAMGGRIAAENGPDGAIFTIHLRDAPAPETLAESATEAGTG